MRGLWPYLKTARWLPYVALALSGLLLTLPLLVHGFWPFCWDARLHVNWHANFSQQFWQGELYPRWLMNMNEGLGSPVFFYYPPVPYWITSLLEPLAGTDPLGWNALAMSSALALVLSGLFAFGWLRCLARPWPAFTAAWLYLLMPYHLRTDLYVRGAFAEFWTFAWIPCVLWCVHRVAARGKLAIPCLAVAYALLIATHLPTTLIFSCVPIVYAWLLAEPGRRTSTLFRTSLGLAMGIGLASIYLLPAMTLQQHVSMDELTNFLHYSKSFFFGEFTWQNRSLGDDFKTTMFWLMLSTLAAGVLAFSLSRTSGHSRATQGDNASPHPNQPAILPVNSPTAADHAANPPQTSPRLSRTLRYFWLAILLLSFVMMLKWSDPIWRLVSVIQIIQFPWRFGTVLCTAVLPRQACGRPKISKMSVAAKAMPSGCARASVPG